MPKPMTNKRAELGSYQEERADTLMKSLNGIAILLCICLRTIDLEGQNFFLFLHFLTFLLYVGVFFVCLLPRHFPIISKAKNQIFLLATKSLPTWERDIIVSIIHKLGVDIYVYTSVCMCVSMYMCTFKIMINLCPKDYYA